MRFLALISASSKKLRGKAFAVLHSTYLQLARMGEVQDRDALLADLFYSPFSDYACSLLKVELSMSERFAKLRKTAVTKKLYNLSTNRAFLVGFCSYLNPLSVRACRSLEMVFIALSSGNLDC